MLRSHRFVALVGVLFVVLAVGQAARTLAIDGVFLKAALDFALISFPGIVLLYVGVWLPSTEISSDLYPRVVGWTLGGVAVMFVVILLRALHPGVVVHFSFGTRAIALGIGGITGLGIGLHEVRAITHKRELERRNAQLQETLALKERNRELQETQKQLERSNERLEQFAYAASHDLREPLRMVTSYLQLLDRRYGDDLDGEAETFIEHAVDGADRMRDMIDGLLAYSRVESRGDPFTDVDLNCVLDDALADLQLTIDETDATITSASLPTVQGDGRQLRQVFQNLLSNALQYSGDEPPRIHVSVEESDRGWTIFVQDDGIGIDPEQTDRIFRVFHRLHSVDEYAGSGIGLALCKRIVERHGGRIWVDSEPGQGSTFSFFIPGDPANGSAMESDVRTPRYSPS